MFTGIVEDLGEVEAVEHGGDSAVIVIRSAKVAQDARPGDSVAVNGVCLTVTGVTGGTAPPADPLPAGGPPGHPSGFAADVMGETLARSSLAGIAPGAKVNLERSVRLDDRLGGHLVQGHVDGTATIISRIPQEQAPSDPPPAAPAPGGTEARRHAGQQPPTPAGSSPPGCWEVLRISLPAGLARYVVHKGSITVDGVSLTVSALSEPGAPAGEDWLEVSLIPETLKRTTLGLRKPGETVNLEVDVIAKYVERLCYPDGLPAGTAGLPGAQAGGAR